MSQSQPSSQFKDIKHRVIKQLTVIFPSLATHNPLLQIRKSPSLQPLYKVIPCPPIPPKVFKQCLDAISVYGESQQQYYQQQQQRDNNINNPNNKVLILSQTLRKTQQYFTACINILQHNEKVRQQYEMIVVMGQEQYVKEVEEISQMKRLCANVKSKSQLSRVVKECGGRMLGMGGIIMSGDNSNKNNSNINDTNNNNSSKRGSNNNNNKPTITIRQQFTQLYLPAHADQYQFISLITQDQYLTYHQQVLQTLLIYLNTISTINQKLQQQQHKEDLLQQQQQINNSLQLIQQITQLLTKLLREQLFCVQDNLYNKLIKFVLQKVHDVKNNKMQLFKQNVTRNKQQIKESLIKVYYLQFMAREQIQIINKYVQQLIMTNQQILLSYSQHQLSSLTTIIDINNNNQKITKQLQQIHQLKQQVKLIFFYLCNENGNIKQQQMIFPLIYKRKLRKFVIKYQILKDKLLLAQKINKTILQMMKKGNSQSQLINRNLFDVNAQKIKDLQRKSHQLNHNKSVKSLGNNNNKRHILARITQQLQTFANSNLQPLINNINTFINTKLTTTTLSGDNQIVSSTFIKMYRQLQQYQLRVSEIQSKYIISCKNGMQEDGENSQSQLMKKRIQTLKHQIIDIENTLILKFKQVNQKNGGKFNLLNNNIFQPSSNKNNPDFDNQSIISITSSSKSSIFSPIHIQQSDIILPKPLAVNQSYLPSLSPQQLIKTANQFVTNQFIQNGSLYQQLEDAKNVNLEMLNCLVYLLEKEINKIGQQVGEKRVSEMQSPNKNNVNLNNSNNKTTKQSQSPQKKGKMSRQKPIQKSPTKPSLQKKQSSSPSKNKNQPQSQQSTKKQQPNSKQLLTTLRDKLTFIREILCPEISQCRVSKIFQHTLHIQIFQKLFFIITNYKQKIFTQRVYSIANTYGFMKFIQQRVSFINTLTKNHQQLLEIFKFIQIFSQQQNNNNKVKKFQPTDERTFQIILKALLASKQIQAYRRQNLDLAKLKKLSSSAVKMLDEEIYIPFIMMFKNLLKVVSSQQSVVKELEKMLESVKLAVEIKQGVRILVLQNQKQNQKEQVDSSIINKIEKIIGLIITLKRFTIFKYSKIDAINKSLRSSLQLPLKQPSEDGKSTILAYLRTQLFQTQNGKQQPIIS